MLIALGVIGLLLVPALLSGALAPVGEVRQDAALCTIIGIGWAYAVGYAQYWSTYNNPLIDALFISAACVVAQAKLCRKKTASWLIACAALHAPTILASSVAGTLARGLAEDPRM